MIHRLSTFGITIWRRRWPLDRADSASVDLINDSAVAMYRPRWYQLNLWSCSLQSDHEVMRSNEPEELKRLMIMLNDAIGEVCAKPAS